MTKYDEATELVLQRLEETIQDRSVADAIHIAHRVLYGVHARLGELYRTRKAGK